MGKRKKRKPVRVRNAFALHASMRKAVPFKDKRAPKGGARNKQAEYREED